MREDRWRQIHDQIVVLPPNLAGIAEVLRDLRKRVEALESIQQVDPRAHEGPMTFDEEMQ